MLKTGVAFLSGCFSVINLLIVVFCGYLNVNITSKFGRAETGGIN
jgi:hypothetical protein